MTGGYHMGYLLAAVAVMAVVTYLVRMLPLTLMRRKINNPFIRSFLYYIPYAVLSAMTVPAVLYATADLISAVVGLAVAVLLAYQNRGLLIVALGAVFAVFVTEQLMLFL